MLENFQTLLIELLEQKKLSSAQLKKAFSLILSGQVYPEQIAAFLTTLKLFGENKDQLVALAHALKAMQINVEIDDQTHVVDNCGTGGDGLNLFNISTASAMVAASCGAKVCKHGNRAISSKTGSADVLEALGVKINLSPKQIAQCLKANSMAFMFAPMHHSAIAHVGTVRKRLGYRTIFNLVGPLVNPANVKRQIIGVFDRKWLNLMAESANELSCEHVLVVHSKDGLNEISIADQTDVVEVRFGQIKTYTLCPEDFGFSRFCLDDLRVESAQESAKMIQLALSGQSKAAEGVISLNAGACLYVSGVCDDLASGVKKAQKAIYSGAALEKLEALIEFSKRL